MPVRENNLGKIEHIVVLMMENRSFDNMLGWLYDPANRAPFEQAPREQPFDGVSGKNLSNPIPPGVAGWERQVVPVGKGLNMVQPDPDPGEDFPHVNTQLFGQADLPDPLPSPAPMDGFVKDYIPMIAEAKGRPATYDDYKTVMDCFTPDRVPVLSALANAYAVCDQWHASVPSQTMCNRSFFHAASSAGLVNNEPYSRWLKNTAPTIFNRMEEAGLGWKVYYDPLDLVSLTWVIHRSLFEYYPTRFFHSGQFFADARAGKLPQYSFIEPRFLFSHNDQHPPHGVLPGEALINKVYQAVRASPCWEKTLLIITYDEHGGCYDHVSPSAAVPPNDGFVSPDEFPFDRLGVRVPAVLISPWIEPGTVYRGAGPLDHTCLIKTICSKWELEPLTDRDRAAEDLGPVLTRGEARTDHPIIRPRFYIPELDLLEVGREAVSGLHRAIVGTAAARAGVEMPEMSTVSDVAGFLKDLRPRLLSNKSG